MARIAAARLAAVSVRRASFSPELVSARDTGSQPSPHPYPYPYPYPYPNPIPTLQVTNFMGIEWMRRHLEPKGYRMYDPYPYPYLHPYYRYPYPYPTPTPRYDAVHKSNPHHPLISSETSSAVL